MSQVRNSRNLASIFVLLAGWVMSATAVASPNTEAPKGASDWTRAELESFGKTLEWSDDEDFQFAKRNLVAEPEQRLITADDGSVVRDLGGWSIFGSTAPDTVNPSLWRQSALLSRAGLYKVTERVYQVRGFDVSNMTVIVGDRGYIVVDTLMSVETARAALALVRKHLGDRPVTAIIYTHSHIDHYGGAAAVVAAADNQKAKLEIIAPGGFMAALIEENLIAGPAMSRRFEYQIGTALPFGPRGAIGSGATPPYPGGVGKGALSLVAPTRSIDVDQTLVLDGVRFDFQLTPGTEAPSEMNFYLPDFRALCMAENANASLHNLLTPRGAQVRDAKLWAGYLNSAIERFGARSDVVFMQHFWPRWGTGTVIDFLSSQRDTYKYIHDQAVRMMNDGLAPSEISEQLTLPDSLGKRWYNRSYWGSLKFNAKAVFQRYLGWYDGNPVNLDPLPPKQLSQKYVAAMGGATKALQEGRRAILKGEYRWAVRILSDVVLADSANQQGRTLLADAFEQLGYQAENGPWRNSYLMAAQELRGYNPEKSPAVRVASVPRTLQIEAMLDLMAVRLDPAENRGRKWSITLIDTATERSYYLTVANDVLNWTTSRPSAGESLRLRLRASQLADVMEGKSLPPDAVGNMDGLNIIGGAGQIPDFFRIFAPPLKHFPLVTRP